LPSDLARRYYTDAYTTAFDATVIERLTWQDRPAVVLDQTYFYPTSGGQPHDRGTLDGANVLDVTVRDADGAVLHVLDAPPRSERVTGKIDWQRRFDHMQQHTGQHVLSQAFVRVAGATTVGFHLGEDYAAIDLDAPALDDAACAAALELANETVSRDLPVRAWFPTPAELATITLRKTPEVEGALRIVAVGDFDLSACGGTHVARTGEIGLIHQLRLERIKRGSRVAFLCGARARRDYVSKHAITARLSTELTCAVGELPAAVSRLQEELKAARRELARHHEEALGREALELRDGARGDRPRVVVARAWEARPVEELRSLALKATSLPDTIVLLGTAGERAQFVFARSENLTVDLRPALDAALAAIGGGRGGGARVVQGGGGAARLEAVVAALDTARAAVPA
jgi:alanyl-tRNA synthetase